MVEIENKKEHPVPKIEIVSKEYYNKLQRVENEVIKVKPLNLFTEFSDIKNAAFNNKIFVEDSVWVIFSDKIINSLVAYSYDKELENYGFLVEMTAPDNSKIFFNTVVKNLYDLFLEKPMAIQTRKNEKEVYQLYFSENAINSIQLHGNIENMTFLMKHIFNYKE
jgi:N-dimethylarginine dimethylaminohydrolase